MAVKFRNRLTGSIMWVADDRAEEYRQFGHKEVVDTPPEKPTKRTEVQKSERRNSTRRTSNRDERERW